MDVILYNPLSRNGKSIEVVYQLKEKLEKKGRLVQIENLLTIKDVKTFLTSHLQCERFIILGGDGTLNRLVNEIRDIDIKQDIYLLKAGTGNDFLRSINPKNKNDIVDIKKYLKNLPIIKFNNKEKLFLNGVGLGLDGYVCHELNISRNKKNKRNYFKNTFRAFKKYQPKKSKIILDEQHEIKIEKTWLVSVLNSKYLGGGMKFAPKADRLSEYLYVVIIKDAPKWLISLIFPLIYLGWHQNIKKYVEIHQVKKAEIIFEEPSFLQIDGEDYNEILQFSCEK